jgi:lysozyme family protein
MPTYSATGKGYAKLWDEAQIKEARRPELERIAKQAIANKERYVEVQRQTSCPWYMIAAIHMREGSMNFMTHLHEGSPLGGRTRNIPKGRPKDGEPPFTWEYSAKDALTVPPHDMRTVAHWSVERMLYELEKYNGWGYMGKVNSPYVWAGTTNYRSGKYVADGIYDPTHVDRQQGCAAIIKAIAEKDEGVKRALEVNRDKSGKPPKDLVDAEKKAASKTGKVVTGAGTGTGTVAGGAEATTKALPEFALYGGLGVGIALVIIGIFIWHKAHKDTDAKLNELWNGVPA